MNLPVEPDVARQADTSMPWQQHFAALGDSFFVDQPPTPLPAPYWVAHNPALGQALGLPAGWQHDNAWLQAFSGNTIPTGSRPLASVYSGHQFGVWAGQLGDGRAILLGELAGQELQLKGAGLTPFSRMGDGRAVLRSSIREFLCSEAMHGLGIPSTRALALTGSPAPVRRETLETAAVLTRVAPSFVRFGHFEHFCHHDQPEALRQLADYVLDRYYPDCRADRLWPNPYVALLARVTERTATLMAQWQSVGFCHGVMNTDNMSVLGLTIDYGPFQFLDAYHPAHICNHSDTQGRYAFHKQPAIAYWNLFCLGQALLPLMDEQDSAIAALETFKTHYPAAFEKRMLAKLGFVDAQPKPGPTDVPGPPGSQALGSPGSLPPPLRAQARTLIERVLGLLAADRVDYSIFWRRLSQWALEGRNGGSLEPDAAKTAEVARTATGTGVASVRDLFLNRHEADAWLQSFERLITDAGDLHSPATMLARNPHYVLRNHLCELAIRAAQQGDFSKVTELQQVLQAPYTERPGTAHLSDFAPDWAADLSISCSS